MKPRRCLMALRLGPAVASLVLAGLSAVGVVVAGDAPASLTRRVAVAGAGAYINVDAAGLAAMLADKGFPLINVHIPYEGEIKGTDLHVPFDTIQAHTAALPAERSARIVLYCRSGYMSAIAAEVLVKLGYTNVWNLEGGMRAWTDAGYPLIRKRP